MDHIFRLRDSVIGYLSPKRRRTVGPTTPANQLSAEACLFEPHSEPQGQKAQAALLSKFSAKYITPPDTRFGANTRKRAREDEHNLGETGSYNSSSEISPDESASQVTTVNGSEAESTIGGDMANDLDEDIEEGPAVEEVSSNDKVAEYLARQAELVLRKEAIAEVKARGDWHPDEIFLFERLSMRSFEEIFPKEWKLDFPTLSEDLFTSVQEKTFINYNCGTSAAGHKALQRIFNLGWRVKDKADLFIPTERFIASEIQKYIEWSEKDGGYSYHRFIPVITVVAARPREAIDSISKKITDQMDFLAEKHRENLILPSPRFNKAGETELYLRQPPLLYGIIVAQTKAIFVTLNSSDVEAKLKHIAHVDLKQEGHSVWNGLALAIIAVMARNYMMSIRDELEEEEEDIPSDPDA